MASGQFQSVLRFLRKAAVALEKNALTDAQLLERFVRQKDEAAFEVLVWRHSTMILATCQRVLHDTHDAEDAFQATFLAFLQQAASIGKREALAGWLHKVAFRIALRLRSRSANRARHEKQGVPPSPGQPADVASWNEVCAALDEELTRLPDHQRVPFVLCYLEGKTTEDAARQLNCPKGTVLSRLARARERLRSRLSRRGLIVSAGLFTAAMSPDAASAAAPVALVHSTVKAALEIAAGSAATSVVSARVAALSEGMVHAMLMTKLKIVAAVLVVAGGLFGVGIGFPRQEATAEKLTPIQKASQPKQAAKEEQQLKGDHKEIQGTWMVAKSFLDGEELPEDARKRGLQKITFDGDRIRVQWKDRLQDGKFTLDTARKPKALDMILGEFISYTREGIYRLEGNELTVCFGSDGEAARPGNFADQKVIMFIFKRQPKEEAVKPKDDAAKQLEIRQQSAEYLSQLALAMHRYLDKHEHFPAAAISKDKKPLLSWRVEILPFLGLGDLYKQFKLDEPWDSQHNKKLLAKMPKVFLPAGVTTEEAHSTYYQVFVGKHTVFEPGQKIGVANIPDGTSNTLLIVEAKTAVPWTKPADIAYAPDKEVPALGGIWADGFNVSMADSSVYFLKRGIDPTIINALITRNGGEVIDYNALER
jgi:RNA polymerase sigma factor (sigma-70 family)